MLGFPPGTEVGFRVKPLTVNGLTVRVAVLLRPLNVAVMVTVLTDVTDCVVTVKVDEPELPETVTEAGTDATAGLELVRAMTSPPGAATPLSVTVPVEVD